MRSKGLSTEAESFEVSQGAAFQGQFHLAER